MYFVPYIDAAGLHIPSYSDILAFLVASFQSIYGQNAYLGNDSADYQMISVTALKIYDTYQAIQLVYNNRSPGTAIGAALDGVVQENGLARKVPSYSSCQVTVTGVAGTVITNGQVVDSAGNAWNLPTPVTIPAGGSITVTAVCTVLGAIQALIGTITTIGTPTSGWISVTNPVAAIAGQPVEPDSALRARQAVSTALPSITRLDATKAALAALSGVTRSTVYENFTNITDGNGLLPHSIWAVVEGGAEVDIANAIFLNKTPGGGVNGTTSYTVTDPYDGTQTVMEYSVLQYTPVYVSISVHLLAGGTSASLAAIQTALTTYLNSLAIGQGVALSSLYAVAMSCMTNFATPSFAIESLKLGTAPAPSGTADIVIAFDHASQGVAANIVVTSV